MRAALKMGRFVEISAIYAEWLFPKRLPLPLWRTMERPNTGSVESEHDLCREMIKRARHAELRFKESERTDDCFLPVTAAVTTPPILRSHVILGVVAVKFLLLAMA